MRTKKVVPLVIIGVIAAAALLFFGLFHVQNVEVVGNARYSDQEIESMVLSNFLNKNTVWLSKFRKTVYPEQVSFVESIDIEYIDRASIRLLVSEDTPIGFIEQQNYDYYFDVDGRVLEAIPVSDAQESLKSSSISGADNAENDSGALNAVPESSENREYRPALTNIPKITGLTEQTLKAGEKIETGDKAVFDAILSIAKLLDKLEIRVDCIEVSEKQEFTLHLGDVRVQLGTADLLEEKLSRTAAILPELTDMKGVLHLETFSEDTQNIIFKEEKI